MDQVVQLSRILVISGFLIVGIAWSIITTVAVRTHLQNRSK